MTRPSTPNALYYGDVRRTVHNRQEVSLIGILGRAWEPSIEEMLSAGMSYNIGPRWFFQPNIPDPTDANIYIVYRDSLTFI